MRSLPALALLLLTLGCRAPAATVHPARVAPPPPAGLDRLLSLVPTGSQYMIARDATVLIDYIEEGMRFVDGPLATLRTGPLAQRVELHGLDGALVALEAQLGSVKSAIDGSGVRLQQGAAIALHPSGSTYFIYSAPDPSALPAMVDAMGVSDLSGLRCKAITSTPGFNVCADSPEALDAYAPTGDPQPLRNDLSGHAPGMSLDEANFIVHLKPGTQDELYMVVSTPPGRMTMALHAPGNPDLADLGHRVQPGPSPLLARAQEGAGFLWVRVNPTLLRKEAGVDGSNPERRAIREAITGEMLMAGLGDPGALILQLGVSDVAPFDRLLDRGFGSIEQSMPTQIPALPGATLVLEQVYVGHRRPTTQAIHVEIANMMMADTITRSTGLHPDAWLFATQDAVTLAVGPDPSEAGALVEASTATERPVLASFAPALTKALAREEVSMIMHLPLDVLQGRVLRDLVRTALGRDPLAHAQVLALAGLLAPFSSMTMWVTVLETRPFIYLEVQSVGNRATAEGRAALDAAHAVADGGDPAEIFGRLATAHAGSPMASSYEIRAGRSDATTLARSGGGAVIAGALLMLGAKQWDLGMLTQAPPQATTLTHR